MKTTYTNNQLVGDFKTHLLTLGRSANTIKTYMHSIGHYVNHCQSNGLSSVVAATWSDIEAYQLTLLGQSNTSTHTVESYMRGVRAFYRYLRRQEIIIHNPTKLVPLPKTRKQLPRTPLSKKEMFKLLDAPDTKTDKGIRHKAILETLYSTGIRLGALCNLSIYDMDTRKGEVTLRDGKGGASLVVPVGEMACIWVCMYRDTVRIKHLKDSSVENLFIGTKGRPINRLMVQTSIREYAKKLGITKQTSPHVIRTTTATHLLQNGASIMHVKEMLGHKLVSTTQVYTRITINDLRKAHSKFHPLERK
jgi:integrase/recombinase XerD